MGFWCSKWWVTQILTTHGSAENKRLPSAHLFMWYDITASCHRLRDHLQNWDRKIGCARNSRGVLRNWFLDTAGLLSGLLYTWIHNDYDCMYRLPTLAKLQHGWERDFVLKNPPLSEKTLAMMAAWERESVFLLWVPLQVSLIPVKGPTTMHTLTKPNWFSEFKSSWNWKEKIMVGI